MKNVSYKNRTIETVLTEENQPVYIAYIDGIMHTSSSNKIEGIAIKKAKKIIDSIVS